MLIVSTGSGQKLVISDLNVTLTVLEVRGDRVRLGISAPADMLVRHLEVRPPPGAILSAQGSDPGRPTPPSRHLATPW
jgi:carbon storage regulator